MRKISTHTYNDIISPENLLLSWKEFLKGKRGKKDVQEFSLRLMDNILELHKDLKEKTYRHGSYEAFNINDPKPRNIHKTSVKDRLLHHAVYRILYPFFNDTFIADSYSCRKSKGTHKALRRFKRFGRKVSKNDTKTCWVLKCDIKKFFASIDHKILRLIVRKYIDDEDINWLLYQVVESFETEGGKGLPLGNLTSQLFVNIYMNEFDQFVKHNLKAKYYIRYADDFIIFHNDRKYLEKLTPQIKDFLRERLKLKLHPDKVFIRTLSSGLDFLGWVHFPNYRVLRTTTKKRLVKRFKKGGEVTRKSYLGLLKHGNTFKLKSWLSNLS